VAVLPTRMFHNHNSFSPGHLDRWHSAPVPWLKATDRGRLQHGFLRVRCNTRVRVR
jgi:hypothetical protein